LELNEIFPCEFMNGSKKGAESQIACSQ